MAITQDGSQEFGISNPTFDGFIVESFSKSFTANRVDLDDGNGEPLGSVTIPGRQEVSLTVQVGSGNTTPTIGEEITYDGEIIIITDVSIDESSADYTRLSLSGYVKINTAP